MVKLVNFPFGESCRPGALCRASRVRARVEGATLATSTRRHCEHSGTFARRADAQFAGRGMDMGAQKNWARCTLAHRAPLVTRREGTRLLPDTTGKRGKP